MSDEQGKEGEVGGYGDDGEQFTAYMLVTTEEDAITRFFLSSFASNPCSSVRQNKNSTLYNKNYLSMLYIKIILFPARSQHMIPLDPVSFLPFFFLVAHI